MPFFNKRSPGPIEIAQSALAEGQPEPGQDFYDSINDIVTKELWCASGTFSDFGEFAIALPRNGGLGVRSVKIAKRLKFALMDDRHIREWTAVLLRIKRPIGHPKTLNNDESFQPFYEVGTSMNSQDRALVALSDKYPERLEDVCQHKCSISAAAIQAGLKPSPPAKCQIDLDFIFGMHVDAQVVLMRNLFNRLGLETQAAVIAQIFEGVLGSGLAQKWRDARGSNGAA